MKKVSPNFPLVANTSSHCPRQAALYNVLHSPIDLLASRPSHLAFHNLCDSNTVLPDLRPLLGLGLNFCIKPPRQSLISEVKLDKFSRDYNQRVQFSYHQNDPDDDDEVPKLYLPDPSWEPDEPCNPILSSRRNNFLFAIRLLFANNIKVRQSLMPHQLMILQWLLDHPEIVVLNSDKNLGPAVIERERYVELAWLDHLSDRNTYQRLSLNEAINMLKTIRSEIEIFTDVFTSVDNDDRTFIIRTLENVQEESGFSFMYLLAKIHKTPLRTRAIISYSGSICHGIALWVDSILKLILKHMSYVAISSKLVVEHLKSKIWNENCHLFSMDAVSMYTNIHFGHAKSEILYFLEKDPKGIAIVTTEKIPILALIRGLEIVMTNNVFQFGDTYWKQTAGTAMGGPPAPNYAMLYFGIHEERIIPKYPELEFYTRYIDDTLNIWKPLNNAKTVDRKRIDSLVNDMNSYGAEHQFFVDNPSLKPLQWTITDICKKTIFLDLDITLQKSSFYIKIYEKELDLHLYIPPHSCHSLGVLKGFIFGSIHRAKNLFTNPKDMYPFIKATFYRLRHRGHSSSSLIPLFSEGMSSILDKPNSPGSIGNNQPPDKKPLYIQLPFNPADPPRKAFHKAFTDNILHPANQPHLSEIPTMNSEDPDGSVDFDRIQICYTKNHNLGSLLSPRKLRMGNFSINKMLQKFGN